MSHVSDDVREAIDNDPFGNKAITFARGRRFTAREAETTVAPLLDEFHHDGFVIIRNLLAADQLAAIREEFDRLHGAYRRVNVSPATMICRKPVDSVP